MKKLLYLFILILFLNCQNYGKLKVVSTLPSTLKEVSGIEIMPNSDVIWMINDSGNKPILYGVSLKGKIKKEIFIRAKNHDWEDVTSDEKGNIYIGDFGNNRSERKNLVILKVNHQELASEKEVKVERIQFSYPEQTKFPPKKKKLFFDAESFFYWNNNFYIFTKSRVKGKFGKTTLYRVPAIAGNHKAELISTFENCNELECWITSADISSDGKKVALLTHTEVLVFSDFEGDNFFTGKIERLPLGYISQKESVVFKDKNTLYITDEKAHGTGGMLYEFKLD